MVRDIAVEIEATGGAVTRVILDDELKGHAFRELHALRQRSDRDDAELHATVASAQRLTCDRDHFVFPDVQLEIEEADGRVTIRDLELVTEHYHRGHLSGKASAGFHMFGERASAGRRGGRPHDPRNLKKII